MSNKTLPQYTDLASLPSDSVFYTYVSGQSYKTTLSAIQSGLGLSVLDLTDTPSSYATISSRSDPAKYYFLSVNSAGNATQFANVRFTDLANVPNTIASMESDSNGQRFLGVALGASSVTAEYVQFTGLEDTPNSYAGSATYLVRVNSGGDALEFVDPSSIIAGNTGFLELDDTPSSYAGQAGKYVRVDSSGTGLEFTSSISANNSVKCGETLNLIIPTASAATDENIAFPPRGIKLDAIDGSEYVIAQWMKPTGFDSGYDITMNVSFIGTEHDSNNPRYYYNIYCVTGTTGTAMTSDPTLGSPLIADYVDMTSAASNELRKKQHTFSCLLSEDVVALYFWMERTSGTSGADTASGINLNGIGLTYYQTAT